jgi:hypothetical protein
MTAVSRAVGNLALVEKAAHPIGPTVACLSPDQEGWPTLLMPLCP